MKIKLLIIVLAIIVAAVGGSTSVNFSQTEKSINDSNIEPNEIEVSKVTETINE